MTQHLDISEHGDYLQEKIRNAVAAYRVNPSPRTYGDLAVAEAEAMGAKVHEDAESAIRLVHRLAAAELEFDRVQNRSPRSRIGGPTYTAAERRLRLARVDIFTAMVGHPPDADQAERLVNGDS